MRLRIFRVRGLGVVLEKRGLAGPAGVTAERGVSY